MLKITFDTSAAIDSVSDATRYNATKKEEICAAHRLREAHENGTIIVFHNVSEEARGTEQIYEQSRGPALLDLPGHCELGKTTILASDELSALDKQLRVILNISPPNMNSSLNDFKDYALLLEHIMTRRDIFVTNDRKSTVYRNREKLKADFHLVIMTSREAVDYLVQQDILKST